MSVHLTPPAFVSEPPFPVSQNFSWFFLESSSLFLVTHQTCPLRWKFLLWVEEEYMYLYICRGICIELQDLKPLTEWSITKTTGAWIVWFSFFRRKQLGNFRISWGMCVEKVWLSPSLSVLTTLSQWKLMPSCEAWLAGLHFLGKALVADILYSGWIFSMVRFSEESRYGIWVQRWAASEEKGEQRTSVKHSRSDDSLILHLVSSSTTRLVISLSSKETPDATRAAMVNEKHLTSHSAAWVGSILLSMCFFHAVPSPGAGEINSDIQHPHSGLLPNHGDELSRYWTIQCTLKNCTYGSLLNIGGFLESISLLACGFVFA